jgi:hypothetical protein
MTAVLTLHLHSSSTYLMPPRVSPSAMSMTKNSKIACGNPLRRVHPPPASETSTGSAAKATAAHDASTVASIHAHRCISVCSPAHLLTATRKIIAAKACLGPRTRHIKSST